MGVLANHRFSFMMYPLSTKEIMIEVAEKLPPDATPADAIFEFRQAVEQGFAELDRGERIPLDEARRMIPQWVAKYSSPLSALNDFLYCPRRADLENGRKEAILTA